MPIALIHGFYTSNFMLIELIHSSCSTTKWCDSGLFANTYYQYFILYTFPICDILTMDYGLFPLNIPLSSDKIIILSHKSHRKSYGFPRPPRVCLVTRNAWKGSASIQVHPPWRQRWMILYICLDMHACMYVCIHACVYVVCFFFFYTCIHILLHMYSHHDAYIYIYLHIGRHLLLMS